MKCGFLFPGYSSQYVGLVKDIYDESRLMQEYFEEASACLPINFVKLCFASSEQELARLENAFPALFLLNFSLAQVIKESGLDAVEVAGFDVGQLAAIAYAGGMNLPDALYLLAKYAEIYAEALASWSVAALVVRGLEYDLLMQACQRIATQKEPLCCAVHYAFDDHIITGAQESVDRLENELRSKEIAVKPAPLAIGLHSAMMDPILMHFTKYLAKVDFKDTRMPVIATLDGKPVQESEDLRNLFIESIHKPVHWDLVMKQCADWDVIIHIGPSKELVERTIKRYPDKRVLTISRKEDLEKIKDLIANTGTMHER